MLETSFNLPEGCDELEAWFSCTHADGYTHWDSDSGKNHWLRFSLHDVVIETAVVKSPTTKDSAKDAFTCAFATTAKVDAVEVRWRATNIPTLPRVRTPLHASSTPKGLKRWTPAEGTIAVPKGATIAYDVVYRIGDRDFTDDNQGRWYIAE